MENQYYPLMQTQNYHTNLFQNKNSMKNTSHVEENNINNIVDQYLINSGAQDIMINDSFPEENMISVDDYLNYGTVQEDIIMIINDGPSEEMNMINGQVDQDMNIDQYLINDISVDDYLNYGGQEVTNKINGGVPQEEMNMNINGGDDEFFKNLPIGYHFLPDDKELIIHYLRKKLNNEALPPNRIRTINVYEFSPENLADMFGGNQEYEWYFFSPLKNKNSAGTYVDRKTPDGHWKATCGDRAIISNGDEEIGYRKTLVYYEGKCSNNKKKTDWIMHEYRLKDISTENSNRDSNNLVLCRIHNHKCKE